MKQEQIALIRTSLNMLKPRATDVVTVFYHRLFAMQPALRLLFPTELTEQKRKLVDAVCKAVENLERPKSLLPMLEDLGRRHALYGVRGRHYDVVGKALMRTLNDALGREFTPDICEAWAAFYDLMAETMKRAAREFALNPELELLHMKDTGKLKPIPTLV